MMSPNSPAFLLFPFNFRRYILLLYSFPLFDPQHIRNKIYVVLVHSNQLLCRLRECLPLLFGGFVVSNIQSKYGATRVKKLQRPFTPHPSPQLTSPATVHRQLLVFESQFSRKNGPPPSPRQECCHALLCSAQNMTVLLNACRVLLSQALLGDTSRATCRITLLRPFFRCFEDFLSCFPWVCFSPHPATKPCLPGVAKSLCSTGMHTRLTYFPNLTFRFSLMSAMSFS